MSHNRIFSLLKDSDSLEKLLGGKSKEHKKAVSELAKTLLDHFIAKGHAVNEACWLVAEEFELATKACLLAAEEFERRMEGGAE